MTLDVSVRPLQGWEQWRKQPSGDFWFEADLEFPTDTAARKHLGLWMTSAPSTPVACHGRG